MFYNVPVNTFTDTGGASCIRFGTACKYTDPFTVIAFCSASLGRLFSACVIAALGAGISYKINRCKESYFSVIYFSRIPGV